jgi:acetyltransferase-like isoleucine patch superfamily enzyme
MAILERIWRGVALRLVRPVLATPRRRFVHCGKNVSFGPFVRATYPERVYLGDDILVGGFAFFHSQGGVRLESGTILGPYVSIYSADHNYDEADAVPYDGVVVLRPVLVKQNVWIGGHVVITPGVTVGEGAILAAGSVVAKDVPDFAVVGGSPAKVLKYRDRERYERLKAEGKIYRRLLAEGRLERVEVSSEAHQGDVES